MSQLKHFSQRSLTTYYITALLTIACLALGSHLLQLSAMRDKDGLAALINISGRQRMLSQRIASLAAQYELGDSSAREELLKTIPVFESAHQYLASHYSTDADDAANARLLHQLYFEGPNSLDAQMQQFLRDARQIAATSPNDLANNPSKKAALARLFQQSRAPLLASLDRIVAIHQAESETLFSQLRRLQWIILLILFCTLLLEARFIFYPMVRRIISFASEILHLASTDQLTGVANRRGFLETSAVEIDRLQRYQRPLSLILLDIDHFKRVNDTYGHAAGDIVLKTVAEKLRSHLRPTDIFGRIGGEEFAILAPETDLSGALSLAERLRTSIATLEINTGKASINCTISLGIAEVTPQSLSIDQSLALADSRMYLAKQSGRNCVVGPNPAETTLPAETTA